MTDKEKLIELIRCATFHPVEGVLATIGSRFTAEFIEDIASHMVANGVTVQNWIPVTERLPEREKDVLVYDVDNDEMHVWAFFCDADGDGWVDAAGDMRPWLDATHWMPLPKPPEDGGAENA